MSFPLNGRIAIVENDINEALPLFESFAKNNIPYVFYKGDDIKYLPEEDCTKNDIRILFLDLNLIGENPGANKDVKSTSIRSKTNSEIVERCFPRMKY